ncbi:patatin-like phospholipase family protein [Qipengyuania sp. 6B39]|uniref:patatin-like phospholipase family protein n=1 Tax=Qipengyuania proteolytica TaxID=2867239 RepID=UPI001C88F156|nr:patatin-like phospholipase family protein [Qipengyuania proteolytica]MBX7495032.1 patatin-like phospholipase family protein [Qipengyuania proteolytica]
MAGGLAIVLSGGGAKGAFQVGVLDELIRQRGVDFETAVGTSTGAIQAAAVAQDDIGMLLQFWQGIAGPGDIYKKRQSKLLAILTGISSIYSTGGLEKLLKQAFDDQRIRATGKNLRLAVVNLTNGELRIVGENADRIADWVYASSAMPFFFAPHATRSAQGLDEQWVDGGVRDVTPLDAALVERPRAVLVVRAGARPKADRPKTYASLIDVALRSVDLQSREVSENDLKNVNLINRLLTARTHQHRVLRDLGLPQSQIDTVMRPFDDEISRFRLVPTMVIEPETDLYDTLDFDPPLLAQNMERGRQHVRENWDEIARFLGVAP